MAADSQTLSELAKCLDCQISEGMKLSVIIAQLAQLTGVTDAQTLINQATCYDCQIPSGMRWSVIIAQLDSFSGGAGGCEIFKLTGSDVPDVQVPSAGCGGVAYNAVPEVWVYSGAPDWVKIIG